MDKNLLFYYMNRKGWNVKELAHSLEISTSTFYRKCQGKSEFTGKEIQKLIVLLELKKPMDIFFREKCPNGSLT